MLQNQRQWTYACLLGTSVPWGFELTFSIPLQAQPFAEAWGVVLGKDVVGVLVGRVAL